MQDYEILHVEPSASQAEIRQAYRDLVRVWHPDRFAGDARLQKIADEKLREINEAYLALENTFREPSHPATSFAPRTSQPRATSASSFAETLLKRLDRRPGSRWLWLSFSLLLAALGGMRLYTFLEAPMRALDWITADARRVAVSNGPSLVDTFEGWHGILPQGLDRLLELYQPTYYSNPAAGRREVQVSRLPVRAAPSLKVSTPTPAFVSGVGEIQVHNRTSEDVLLRLKAARVSSPARRRIALLAKGDVTLDNLGPDLYIVDVTFPHSDRPALRLGPFVMVEIATATQTSGDRYEITLKPALASR